MSGNNELCDAADREDQIAAMKAKCDEMNAMEVRDHSSDRRDARVAEEIEFLKRQERDLCRFPDNRAGRRAAASKRRRSAL